MQQLKHLDAIASVVDKYMDKKQAKKFSKDLIKACPDLDRNIKVKYSNKPNSEINLEQLIKDVGYVKPQLENKY